MPFIRGTSYGRRSWARTMLRIGSSWPFASATSTSASTISRMWGFFETSWRALSADHKCPGASTLIVINPYDRMGDCIYRLAYYIFASTCRRENPNQFTKFMAIVASMVMERFSSPPSGCWRRVTSSRPTPNHSAA